MRTSRPTSLSARGRGRWAAKRGVYEGVRGGVGWAAASEIQMAPKPDFESPSLSSRSPSLDSSSFIYSPSLSSSSATPRFFLSFFFSRLFICPVASFFFFSFRLFPHLCLDLFLLFIFSFSYLTSHSLVCPLLLFNFTFSSSIYLFYLSLLPSS